MPLEDNVVKKLHSEMDDLLFVMSEIVKVVNIFMEKIPDQVSIDLDAIKNELVSMIQSLMTIMDDLVAIKDNIAAMSEKVETAKNFSSDLNIVRIIQKRITDAMRLVASGLGKVSNDADANVFDILKVNLGVMNDKIIAMKYATIAMKSDSIMATMNNCYNEE